MVKENLTRNGIAIKPSPIHGHGIFAEKKIGKDEIVEECRFIYTTGNDPGLSDYYFSTGHDSQCAIVTGFGLLYNHSEQPNVEYAFDKENDIAIFKAMRDIKNGEELLINYGNNWFSSRQTIKNQLSSIKEKNTTLSVFIRALLVCGFFYLLARLLAH